MKSSGGDAKIWKRQIPVFSGVLSSTVFFDSTRSKFERANFCPMTSRVSSVEMLSTVTEEALKFASTTPLWAFSGSGELLQRFPDLLIIGPQRCGTSWLSDQLSRRPEFILSNPKETHYFNRLKIPNDEFTKNSSRDLDRFLSTFEVQERRSFLDIFRKKTPKVHIEATASTAVEVDDEVFRAIATINPHIQVILGVRNPVQRAWSHLKLLWREKPADSMSQQEIEEWLAQDYLRQCGDIVGLAEKWNGYVGAENLMTVFFDDLACDEIGVLSRCLTDLNSRFPVPIANTSSKEFGSNGTNSTPRTQGYEWVMEFLEELHREDQLRAEDYFGRKLVR